MARRKLYIGLGILAAVGIAVAGFCIACGRSAPGSRPNVLIITIDTLRADHLGCYGYGPPTSPTIDALAADGALFTKAFAQRGLTWPSLASIMTSTYPITHGVRTNGVRFPGEIATVATALKEEGYACVALMANAVQQDWYGFDEVQYVKDQDLCLATWNRIDALHEEPFLLWVHYIAPHIPYEPADEYLDRFDPDYAGTYDGERDTLNGITKDQTDLTDEDLAHIVALYDGEIAWIDDQVRDTLKILDHYGIKDNTLIVFTSDHGEDLYQHNRYFDHLASVYDSVLHVPLFFHLPDRMPALRCETMIETIDIAPTILDIVGVDAPGSFQGTSLIPLIDGRTLDLDLGPAFAEWQDQIVTVRTEARRYVHNPLEHHPRWLIGDTEPRYPIAKEELYDLKSDPAEARNLIDTNPPELPAARAMVNDWIREYRWELNEFGGESPEVDEELKEQLEAMGYVF
ncbi:MAG: sulfatase-like hydrolase/transferase [bacterium]|nr:sulfatase-like hydrolase/transferase [bacterium]